jgi:hypothetical protein
VNSSIYQYPHVEMAQYDLGCNAQIFYEAFAFLGTDQILFLIVDLWFHSASNLALKVRLTPSLDQDRSIWDMSENH